MKRLRVVDGWGQERKREKKASRYERVGDPQIVTSFI